MKYLATEKVNRGRQPEIDCLKAFCIVFMILLHAYEECAEEPGGFYNVLVGIEALTGAGAFMICMGLGMRYSRRQSPKDDLTRGFALLTVSQLLNLLRDSLPCLIAYWGTGRQIFLATALLIVQTDILTFAGFAFLLIALLRHLKLSDGAILGLGFGMNVAAFALSGVFRTTGNYLLDQLLGFFLVTDAEAYFPLGCYFVFVAFGYALGGLYLRIKDKDALSTRVLLVCGPIAAVYYALRFTVPFPLLPDFFSIERYVMTPATDAVALCLMTLCVLSLFHKLLRLGGGEPPRFVKHLSGHINQYYCVSYVFFTPVGTLLLALRDELLPGTWLPLLYGLLVLAACYFIIEWNDKRLHFGIANLKGRKRTVVYAAIWIATLAIIVYVYPQVEEYATVWNDYLLAGE